MTRREGERGGERARVCTDLPRFVLVAGLRASGAKVHFLGSGHSRANESDLAGWGQPIFAYSSTAMQTAAVDLLALSRCDLILGTRHSTFSYVAQAILSRRQARGRARFPDPPPP